MSEVANAWVVQEAKKFEPLPVGFYHALFRGVEEKKLPSGEDKWRFVWEETTGEHTGKIADALCDRTISPLNQAGRLIEGLLGQPLKPGDNVKSLVDACVGKPYLVSIQGGPKGGKPCVRSIGKPPA
jgi:hypothetical protein